MNKTKLIALGAVGYILGSVFIAQPADARVTIKEARAIYKCLKKQNRLAGPELTIDSRRLPNGECQQHEISITKGALQMGDRAEVANILGHELAHWKFKDAYAPLTYRTFREDRADRYGSQYAWHIGYSKCAQARIYKLYSKVYGKGWNYKDEHSPDNVRYYRICGE